MNDPDLDRESVEFDDGTLPVVAQDADSGVVLMVAYATPEAVAETLDTGYAHYYSRSREELWRKGASSGHTQRIRDVLIDCDGDTLLYRVEQAGGACHTGHYSCFHRSIHEIDAEARAVTEPGPDVEIGADVRRVADRTFDPEDVYGGV